jgi:hypothetical protein
MEPKGFWKVKAYRFRDTGTLKVKVKAALSGLFDTDAYWHIVSLPLTEFTPSSPEALHTKQA